MAGELLLDCAESCVERRLPLPHRVQLGLHRRQAIPDGAQVARVDPDWGDIAVIEDRPTDDDADDDRGDCQHREEQAPEAGKEAKR